VWYTQEGYAGGKREQGTGIVAAAQLYSGVSVIDSGRNDGSGISFSLGYRLINTDSLG
jgi:hypothetical protein